jgi:hypothetical protein
VLTALVNVRDQFKASALADSINHKKKQEDYKTETQGLGTDNNDIDLETSKE